MLNQTNLIPGTINDWDSTVKKKASIFPPERSSQEDREKAELGIGTAGEMLMDPRAEGV